MIDLASLPDDVDALKAIIVADRSCIARLEVLVAAFKQAMFGRKSEKLNADQFEFALEDIETSIEAVKAEQDAGEFVSEPRDKKPRAANRGSLPKHLPRIEEIIEPEDKDCSCGGQMHVIGEDVSERLDVIPAQFRVIVTRRPKYGCRSCENGITQMPAPAYLVQGGLPTEALIAHVLVSKYADHLPLYRQAQIYSRQGIDLDRSTLANWVGKAAFELKPVFECLMADLKRSTKLYMPSRQIATQSPAG
jgi:transposase